MMHNKQQHQLQENNMIKHIGRHNSKKVVILYRTVPDEEHMCLITYSDALPRKYHDTIMPILESASGQQAEVFAEALHRNVLHDGRNILGSLHKEGFIKKVPTNQVIVTATPTSQVRLDELNSIISEMKKGEEAIKKMADIDSNRGMKGSNPYAKQEAKDVTEQLTDTAGVLDDTYFAKQNLAQAARMKAEAEGLLKEAARLEDEAKKFLPEAQETKVVKTRAPRNAKKAVQS
jgi:hypothetical protein